MNKIGYFEKIEKFFILILHYTFAIQVFKFKIYIYIVNLHLKNLLIHFSHQISHFQNYFLLFLFLIAQYPIHLYSLLSFSIFNFHFTS